MVRESDPMILSLLTITQVEFTKEILATERLVTFMIDSFWTENGIKILKPHFSNFRSKYCKNALNITILCQNVKKSLK